MNNWTALLLLPNIEIQKDAIEFGDFAAFAPPHDPRVEALCQHNKHLRSFLNRFTDAFKSQLRPTLLIMRMDAPKVYRRIEPVAAIRDALALSVVPYARALRLKYPNGPSGLLHSNYFAFYPWMINRDNEFISLQTMALTAIHEVSYFRGQSSPDVPRMFIDTNRMDSQLFEALVPAFERRFGARKPAWRDIALFRSLNMAQFAAFAPSSIDITIYDIGRALALWVSAFEILAHPGASGRSDLDTVFAILHAISWQHGRLNKGRFRTYQGRGHSKQDLFACALYGHIFQIRNGFLHGNAVSDKSLTRWYIRPGTIAWYAAVLYRLAVATTLDISFDLPMPDLSSTEASANYITAKLDFEQYQRDMEWALVTALKKPA